MSKRIGKRKDSISKSHRPVVPDDDNPGLFQDVFKFIPLIFVYSIRHLTVGTLVRHKLKKLEAKNEKWIIEEEAF